jgi:hypothetical protein
MIPGIKIELEEEDELVKKEEIKSGKTSAQNKHLMFVSLCLFALILLYMFAPRVEKHNYIRFYDDGDEEDDDYTTVEEEDGDTDIEHSDFSEDFQPKKKKKEEEATKKEEGRCIPHACSKPKHFVRPQDAHLISNRPFTMLASFPGSGKKHACLL